MTEYEESATSYIDLSNDSVNNPLHAIVKLVVNTRTTNVFESYGQG
jgi:hypothetical protein